MVKPIYEREEDEARLAASHPFRGLGEPEDIAKAAVFLASDDASWVSGTVLPVDGKPLPPWSEHLWYKKLTCTQAATLPGNYTPALSLIYTQWDRLFQH